GNRMWRVDDTESELCCFSKKEVMKLWLFSWKEFKPSFSIGEKTFTLSRKGGELHLDWDLNDTNDLLPANEYIHITFLLGDKGVLEVKIGENDTIIGLYNDQIPKLKVKNIRAYDFLVIHKKIGDENVSREAEPITYEPVTCEPITCETITCEPKTGEAIISRPMVGEAITSGPMTGEPITSELMVGEAITSGPMTGEPITSGQECNNGSYHYIVEALLTGLLMVSLAAIVYLGFTSRLNRKNTKQTNETPCVILRDNSGCNNRTIMSEHIYDVIDFEAEASGTRLRDNTCNGDRQKATIVSEHVYEANNEDE
ncbi:unnamed protein product, partial [Meganyctiphanes norvegica]